jgi:hypothetical protein
MTRLKKSGRQFFLSLGGSRHRRSLYDFTVVSLAVWLLGGLAILVVWGHAEAEQPQMQSGERAKTSLQLREFEHLCREAEDAYQRATVTLNEAAIEHALHRQAVATFLARHFRDLAIDAARFAAPELTREIPIGGIPAHEAVFATEVPRSSAVAGWGPRRQGDFLVTVEGPSVTYELPRTIRESRELKSSLTEQRRYHELEAAAQASATLMEGAVIAERDAWARMQQAISLYHAALDFSDEPKKVNDSAELETSQAAAAAPVSPVGIGLTAVTALSLAVGYLFSRSAQGLPVSVPQIAAHKEDLTQIQLPVLGTLPTRACAFAEAKRQLAARLRLYSRVDHGRFAAEAILGGALLFWVVLALLQPGFADAFFGEPVRAVADVASRL